MPGEPKRCTNPDCEYGGKWLVGKMSLLKNGKWLCTGRGCHRVYTTEEATARTDL